MFWRLTLARLASRSGCLQSLTAGTRRASIFCSHSCHLRPLLDSRAFEPELSGLLCPQCLHGKFFLHSRHVASKLAYQRNTAGFGPVHLSGPALYPRWMMLIDHDDGSRWGAITTCFLGNIHYDIDERSWHDAHHRHLNYPCRVHNRRSLHGGHYILMACMKLICFFFNFLFGLPSLRVHRSFFLSACYSFSDMCY